MRTFNTEEVRSQEYTGETGKLSDVHVLEGHMAIILPARVLGVPPTDPEHWKEMAAVSAEIMACVWLC